MTKEEMLALRDLIQDAVREEVKPLQSEIATLSAKQDAFSANLETLSAKQEAFSANLETLSARQEAFSANLETLSAKQDAFSANQDVMNDRLTTIELKIENEVDRAIKVLREGHDILHRKLEENVGLESRVETLEHKVSAVEYALKQAK